MVYCLYAQILSLKEIVAYFGSRPSGLVAVDCGELYQPCGFLIAPQVVSQHEAWSLTSHVQEAVQLTS